jgi:hypothetical protein
MSNYPISLLYMTKVFFSIVLNQCNIYYRADYEHFIGPVDINSSVSIQNYPFSPDDTVRAGFI